MLKELEGVGVFLDGKGEGDQMQEQGWSQEDLAWLSGAARNHEFVLSGVAAAEGKTPAEGIDGRHFQEWLDAGFAGEMEYLKRRDLSGELLRQAIPIAIPWARSVVLCAMNYHTGGPLSIAPSAPGAGWIGRYAWSGKPGAGEAADPSDYHDVLLQRAEALAADIRDRLQCNTTRCYVDTGPIVERAVAARAGVGWVGKNTTVIHQKLGSWLLLAAIITSKPLSSEAMALPAADRCGSCTRCLDACPTDALIAAYRMDARRCIAYLTIEKKGPIPDEFRVGMGRQVFGCDICQDVCPWNRRSPIATDSQMMPREPLINPDLGWLADLDSAAFRRWFKGSPLERTGRKRLHRNVAIAMGNSGEARFREKLRNWAIAEDAVLAEAAQWALEQLDRSSIANTPAAENT